MFSRTQQVGGFSAEQRPWLNIFLFSTFSGRWLLSSLGFVFMVYFHISIFMWLRALCRSRSGLFPAW